MVMLDKGYMISHMRNEDDTINMKNVMLGAGCEAAETFQCMKQVDSHMEDWMRFVDRLEEYLNYNAFQTIYDLCQTIYAMKHRNEELKGLSSVREDLELCELYYQVFVGMLDIHLSTKSYEEMGGEN